VLLPHLASPPYRGLYFPGEQMRIIAGTLKGARLLSPRSYQIRPTSDRVREYIFSCLHADVVNSTVLDLFAGTGAFGIEAISRGAAKVVFVDNTAESVKLVRQNLLHVGLNAAIEKKSAELFLRSSHYKFDFIFCDPPYEFQRFDSILRVILENQSLSREGTVIYESSSRATPLAESGFQISRQKKMGDTLITFYTTNYENCSLSGNV
jgi:16S rRNA (guanine966-N2)-methyltransferase